MLVKCAYAINSTAPGFAVVVDEQGQYTINKTLERSDNNEGSANITDIPTGNYSVRVYDDNFNLAYMHSQLQIAAFPPVLRTSTVSTGMNTNTVYCLVNYY